MLIAHLPAGYALTHCHPVLRKNKLWVLTGSILPDFDLLYWVLIDASKAHHHNYLTHRPALWLGLLLLGFVLYKTRGGGTVIMALAAGGMLHMVLDSMAGAIIWGWPIWDVALSLVQVPATHDWWVMSFQTHWSFGVELALTGLAALLFLRERSAARSLRLRHAAKENPGTMAGV